MKALEWWRARPRKHKAAIVAIVLYAIYGLAGYFGGSPLLRQAVVDRISEATGRAVTLEQAVFNPYGLAVTLKDFAFLDADGEAFVAFDRLYFDFELSSLFRWSLYFDDFELDRPRVRVTREAAGEFNFHDLLALAQKEPDQEAVQQDAPAEKPSIFPVSVGRLALSQGEFRYRDLSRGEARTLELDELDFRVRDFSTRGDGTDGNDYSLAVTSPEGGRFNWTGNLTVDPLTLDGRLELSGLALAPLAKFYEERLRFHLPAGELAVATDYALDLGGENVSYSLANGRVTVCDLRLRQPELDEDTLALPELAVEGIALDSAQQSVTVKRVALKQPSLLMRQLEQGVDLQTLVVTQEATPDEADAGESKSTETAETAPANNEAGSPWRFRLNELALTEARLRYRAENLRTPGALELRPLNLTVNAIQWGGEGDFRYQGDTVLNGQGEIGFSGEGNLDPLRADLELKADAVALKPLEPWLQDAARLDLASGRVSTDFEAQATGLAGTPRVTATGTFSGQDIQVRESGDRRLLQLDAFNVAGINFDLAEQSVGAGRIDLNGLNLESVIDEQGRGTAERVALAETAEPANGDGASNGSPWRLRAGEVHLRNSTVAFADYSLQPDFTFGLYQVSADLRNLDTAGDDPARLSLKADVDRYAPLSVQGQLNPDPENRFIDMDVALENYEINSLTPYTGVYIGHTVKSGQLGFDTDLELTRTKLASKTDMRAQNFFLGEKVESDQAVNAPVKLGLAVLRDRDGLIRLPVNASGDLSDPSVSVSGIILQAITNVLVKAATSPFSILGDLAGGEDLDRVPFLAGRAEASPDTRKRLEALKKVLTERPTLNMKLAGSWTRADRLALARADRIQAWKPEAWTSLEAAAEQGSFRRHIRRAYRRILEQDPDNLVPLAEGAAPETRQAHKRKVAVQAFEALVEHGADNLPEARLKQLASERASAAKAYLVQEGGIDGGRLFLQSEPLEDQEAVAGVQVGLQAP